MLSLRQVSTIAQLTILAPVAAADSPLCVINTHLFFHPRASHLRTLHTAAILGEAKAMVHAATLSWPKSLGGSPPAVLFCGDLNSGHNKGTPGQGRSNVAPQRLCL